MSKKTLALIVFLFLVTCGLLYLALVTPPYQKPTTLGPTPTPISVNAHTTLNLMPAMASQSSTTNQYTLAVQINSGDNIVNAVQLELSYDPQALMNVNAIPGDFFAQPTELVKTIDTTDGRISYALSEQISLPGRKGMGNLAYISFDKNPAFTGTSTQLAFLPKTAVAAEKILESVLKKATGYTVMLSNVSGTPIPATGAAH